MNSLCLLIHTDHRSAQEEYDLLDGHQPALSPSTPQINQPLLPQLRSLLPPLQEHGHTPRRPQGHPPQRKQGNSHLREEEV